MVLYAMDFMQHIYFRLFNSLLLNLIYIINVVLNWTSLAVSECQVTDHSGKCFLKCCSPQKEDLVFCIALNHIGQSSEKPQMCMWSLNLLNWNAYFMLCIKLFSSLKIEVTLLNIIVHHLDSLSNFLKVCEFGN